MPPPEKLETENAEMLRVAPFQFLASLLHFRSGWRANQALQRFDGFGKTGEGFTGGKGLVNIQTESAGADEPTAPRRERLGFNRCVPCAGSLSLGR